MAWTLRAVQYSDGSWICRFGLEQLDSHFELADALEHLKQLAATPTYKPAEIFIHSLDGNVRRYE